MLAMYDCSIDPLKRALTNLKRILRKGEQYADSIAIDPGVLLNARLFVDMYPLTRQVQIASDISKGAAARLTASEVPRFEDNETSFEMLYARIDKTVDFLDSVAMASLEGSEQREITLTIRNVDIKFSGQDYLLKWVLPNVYFHVTTAYNILRHHGVALGKSDYLGPRK